MRADVPSVLPIEEERPTDVVLDAELESTTAPERRTFRPDIEGLRAVAVVAVMAYHAGIPLIPGGYVGVDVFFVLSGFLITGLLLKEREGTGRISFGGFYARRARRLLPASTLVVLATLAGALLVGGPLALVRTAEDARAVAAFVVNFHFAHQETGYFALATHPSPFQHYWSLAVEEQFYFLWPALVLLLSLGAATRAAVRRRLTAFLAVLLPVSFAWCMVQTHSSQPHAFFLLPSRAWELGVGALLAVVPVTRLGRRAGTALSVVGVAMVAAAFAVFRETTAFPGWMPAVPVIGVALILVVGGARPTAALPRALSWRPLQHIGRLSYSLYLWHWAVLVVVAMTKPRVLESWPKGTLVVLASVPIAVVAYHLVEDPVRRSSWLAAVPRRSLALGAALVVVGLVVSSLVATRTPLDAGVAAAAGWTASAVVPSNAEPTLLDARTGSPNDGCDVDRETPADLPCAYGDVTANRRMVVFGDSHALMWLPALDAFARSRGWKLEADISAGCPGLAYPGGARCDEHRDTVFARLAKQPPEAVVLIDYGRHSLDRGLDESAWRDATRRTIKAFPRSQVLLFGETPIPTGEADYCLARHLHDVRPCEPDRDDPTFRRFLSGGRLIADDEGAAFVDLTPVLCDGDRCPAVRGTTLVYSDENHVTRQFVRLATPRVERILDRALRG